MSDELYKCVIKPNVRTMKMRSLNVVLLPGTHIIEAFSVESDGSTRVHTTLIPGVGVVDGQFSQPKPNERPN